MIFDFIVLGGGSGGLGSARRAASYGAKVAIVEADRLGGTCVIRGCVPKKVTYNLASIMHTLDFDSKRYAFQGESPKLNYPVFKKMRDAYVTRLNGIYHSNIEKDKISFFSGFGRFKLNQQSEMVVVEVVNAKGEVTNEIQASKVLIATGGAPHIPEIAGNEYGITSDGFFELDHVPKRALIVGTGYIGVEISGILNALGTSVDLFSRSDQILRTFDSSLQQFLSSEMIKDGIRIHYSTQVQSIEKTSTGLKVSFDQKTLETDVVLFATGRKPCTQHLQLPSSVKTKNGYIVVDDYQNTNDSRIFALGDVCGKAELTPVAIAAGRHLSDRLFNFKNTKLDYSLIPTVVFSHPPIGTVGMTEQEAVNLFGERIKVYSSKFINMFYAMNGEDASMDKKPTLYKLVTLLPDEKILGVHIIGMGSDEIIQGFAVAVKMGALKSDFDSTIAIHPTASEELVTMR